MLEAHYGVPMTGAVLHSLNTRLDAPILAFQLDHANTKVLITDREFAPVMKDALAQAKVKPLDHRLRRPGVSAGRRAPRHDRLRGVRSPRGDPNFKWRMPEDEWEAISLNYTSGTTGNPKGVVYHHRGAALMCYANMHATGMGRHPVYLWTLPMFHCNGWCFPWTVSLLAGTHVCLRWVRAKAIYDAIADHKVTNLSGAPDRHVDAAQRQGRRAPRRSPTASPSIMPRLRRPRPCSRQMAEAGFELTHLYGLTETYGPAVMNEWHANGTASIPAARNTKRARQGVRYTALEDLTVMDPATMTRVPADGETLGEVMFRGNIVMKGYLKNPKATDEAFEGGWFHSGDLGVLHPDGYIQLKDRSKDIIISGGENISSIEVEDVLYKHPAVAVLRRRRQARREVGRDAVRLCRAEARHGRHQGRDDRLVPRAARPLQGPAPHRLHRRAAHLDRQDPEVQAARDGQRGLRA